MKTVTTLMAVGLMVLTDAVWAANPPASLVMIPAMINYQGRLVTTSNTPYADAVHTIDLTLYPDAVSPTKLWSERYGVQTRDGYFSVNLGSGGAGQLPVNPEIWQVMWRTNNQSPGTFFMAMTVRTAPNGTPLTTPVEATPRQQFLTAPFAYRAHQALYASQADGLFGAPDGVQTSKVTNDVLSINAQSFLGLGSQGSLVMAGNDGVVMGSTSGDVGIAGTRLNLNPQAPSTNILVRSKPMFVLKAVSINTSAGAIAYNISHGINTSDYDIMIVGFNNTMNIAVRSVWMTSPSSTGATVRVDALSTAGETITVRFLGIRKLLIHHQ